MTFQRYESRPITRLAHEITEDDVITSGAEECSFLLTTKAGERHAFKAHQEIYTGDFVIYHNDDDIYHCPREVFLERNLVPEANQGNDDE